MNISSPSCPSSELGNEGVNASTTAILAAKKLIKGGG